MKHILIVLFAFLFSLSAHANKKRKSRDYISVLKSTYSTNQGGIRKVGDVYEFRIKTLSPNIIIDSVWFGSTPVPCDLFEIKKKTKIEKATLKGEYLVRTNKDLYTNFSKQIDSTEAFNNFKPPFLFKGVAVIMYNVNGKRYYKTVNAVKQVAPKGKR
jgi:hypothetical protein